MTATRIGIRCSLGALTVAAALAVQTGLADEARLRNGLILKGVAASVQGLNDHTSKINRNRDDKPSDPFWLIDDGVRRYFVPNRKTQVERRDDFAGVPTFEFPRTHRPRSLTPAIVGSMTLEDFDEHGRRTVTLDTKKGKESIVQEITRLRPDFATVEGVTHDWKICIDTSTLPRDKLATLVHRRLKGDDTVATRNAIVEFYVDAEMYAEAARELRELATAYPEENDRIDKQLQIVAEQNARKGMREVLRRQGVGQHGLAYQIAASALKAPDEKVSTEVLRQSQDLVDTYTKAREQGEHSLLLLEQYESQLEPAEAVKVKPLRAAVRDELSFETIGRLDPFLRAEEDATLTPAQKLAMAYSAWAVGPSYADTDLTIAVNLWQARFIVLEYIRSSDNAIRREELLKELDALEGVTIERLGQMIPILPYVVDERIPQPGEVRDYEVATDSGEMARFSVVLPLEYHPTHSYPLLVVLRRSGQTTQDALRFWAGEPNQPRFAMNRGYIAIAPEFADRKDTSYDYSITAHRNVLASITQARKLFSVDSDRIFLTGHQLGGDACFDIAFAHPDVFAGAIPFLARPERFSIRTWANGKILPWYIVAGERDRDTLDRNATIVNNLVRVGGADVIYCEYKDRGFESYHEEIPRIFDWMDLHRRMTLAQARELDKGFEMDVMRPTDDRYFWLVSAGLPQRMRDPIVWDDPKKVPKAMSTRSKMTQATIYVWHPGTRTQVWLSPEVVDFEKRLAISVDSRQEFNDFVRPSPEALLEDFRLRGDRQRLYWAVWDSEAPKASARSASARP